MLTLTENASTIVNDIATQPGLAPTAGLRITSENEADPTFEVTAAERPEPGDQTVEQSGAKVYLDSSAAVLLDEMILDAAVDPDGKVEFALAQQA